MSVNRSGAPTRRPPAGSDVLRDSKVFSSGAEMGAIVDTECHCTCRISCCTFGGIRKLAGLFRCPPGAKRRKEKRSTSENESFHQITAPEPPGNVGTRSIARSEIELKQPATPPPPPPGPSTRESPPRFRASFVPTSDMLVAAKSKLKSHQAASSSVEGTKAGDR